MADGWVVVGWLVDQLLLKLGTIWKQRKTADVVVGLARSTLYSSDPHRIFYWKQAWRCVLWCQNFFFKIHFVVCVFYLLPAVFVTQSRHMHHAGLYVLRCFFWTRTAWFHVTLLRWNYIPNTSMSLMIDLIKLSSHSFAISSFRPRSTRPRRKRSS